jgi:cold shock CspA family protein
MPAHEGTLRWFNNAKVLDPRKRHLTARFCHYSAIRGDGYKSLKEGRRVE